MLVSLIEKDFVLSAPQKNTEVVREILRKLVERYQEPTRFYHTLSHLNNGLKIHYHLFQKPLLPLELFAWAYHDSVYNSARSDNEENSAILWRKDAHTLGFSITDADKGAELIIATDPSKGPISVINDMDLAELGASPEVFDQNTDNIRKEYSWVSPEDWKKGRIAVLTQFLNRDKLYFTKQFADKFTESAKNNLKRSICNLSKNVM